MGKARIRCTVNRGFHQTDKATMDCPVHRAIVLAKGGPTTSGYGGSARSLASIAPNKPMEVRDKEGNVEFQLDGKLHRDGDLPAVIKANGDRHWYQHDELHRGGDKPAIEMADGTLHYFKNGVSHRAGGKPTTVYGTGATEYRVKGVRHREGGLPTQVDADGNGTMWHRRGKLHRDDGPSLVFAAGHGNLDYYLDGEDATEDEVYARYLAQFGVAESNVAAREFLGVTLDKDNDCCFVKPSDDDIIIALTLHENS